MRLKNCADVGWADRRKTVCKGLVSPPGSSLRYTFQFGHYQPFGPHNTPSTLSPPSSPIMLGRRQCYRESRHQILSPGDGPTSLTSARVTNVTDRV